MRYVLEVYLPKCGWVMSFKGTSRTELGRQILKFKNANQKYRVSKEKKKNVWSISKGLWYFGTAN